VGRRVRRLRDGPDREGEGCLEPADIPADMPLAADPEVFAALVALDGPVAALEDFKFITWVELFEIMPDQFGPRRFGVCVVRFR
jgi:hypothetical protein